MMDFENNNNNMEYERPMDGAAVIKVVGVG